MYKYHIVYMSKRRVVSWFFYDEMNQKLWILERDGINRRPSLAIDVEIAIKYP